MLSIVDPKIEIGSNLEERFRTTYNLVDLYQVSANNDSMIETYLIQNHIV